MFYLTTHSTHFIYGYMASDIWLRTILIVRKEIRCRHIGYSYRLTTRVLLFAPSQKQDNTYHGLCYTSRGALAGMRNSSFLPNSMSVKPSVYFARLPEIPSHDAYRDTKTITYNCYRVSSGLSRHSHTSHALFRAQFAT